MKGLVTSLILLTVAIILVVINAFYINITVEKLDELADTVLHEQTEASVSELLDYWEKHHPFIGLSVSLREIDRVTENLLNLRTACRECNDVMTEQS